MTWLLNGERDEKIGVLDRGLSYGDGVFRTLKVVAGRLIFWKEHLKKLQQDAERLGLICPDEQLWRSDCEALVAAQGDGVLKLVLTRGESARGYRLPEHATATRLVIWSPAPVFSPEFSSQGIQLRVCNLRLSSQPLLAGVKHLNRLENVLARAEWRDVRYAEGILLNQAGDVVEGVMSNLFWRRGKCWETPRLDTCGVAGVMRDWLKARLQAGGYEINEVAVKVEQLLCVDELLICNSLIGLWPVAGLQERCWSDFTMTLRLQQYLRADEAKSI